MSVAEETEENAEPNRGSKLGLIIGLVLAIMAGGGGFAATYTGMILSKTEPKTETEGQTALDEEKTESARFIALEPLVVSIRSSSKFRLLRFTGQLEVYPDKFESVEEIKPRIVDVMNTYLNAVDASRFEDPIAMLKMRAQLLRRAQIVAGPNSISDLLIMEFILQ